MVVRVPLAMMPVLLTVRVKRRRATVKLLALVAVPAGVVTLIRPVVAPLGTVAEIVVAEEIGRASCRERVWSAVAPVTFVTKIVTGVTTGPLVGVKVVMVCVICVTV